MRVLFIFFSFLALISCSQGSSGKPDQLQFDNEKQARKVLTGDQVVCSGDCPEYVGAFYLYHSPSDGGKRHMVKLCSATLIAKNQILTNKHCIEDVMKEGDLCDDKAFIEVKFPKTGDFPYEVFKCKKILKTSKDYFIPGHPGKRRRSVPDWAIVELDAASIATTQRQPVKMAAGVIGDNTLVDLYPVFFDTSYLQTKGTIKAVSCRQTFKENNLYASDSDSPLFEMKKCSTPLVHGNSGSGVFLHGESRLLGVMATGDSSDNTSAGTMAHCIPQFSSASDDCVFSEDRQYTEIMKALFYLNTHMKTQVEEVAASLASQPSSVLQWDDKQIDRDSLKMFSVQYESPWDGYVSYLKSGGKRRLQAKLEVALLRVMVPLAPRCALKGALETPASLTLATFSNWNFLGEFAWQETPVAEAGGGYSVSMNYSLPGNSITPMAVNFKGTAIANGVKLESSGALPAAAKSIKIQLPACH